MDLDKILLNINKMTQEEFNYIDNYGKKKINGIIKRKNIPCFVSEDDKTSIVNDALIRFLNYYEEGKGTKPSTFFSMLIEHVFIRKNTKEQDYCNTEKYFGDEVLFNSIDGGLYEA